MLNKIVLVGRLTKDAQIFEKEEGSKVATFLRCYGKKL